MFLLLIVLLFIENGTPDDENFNHTVNEKRYSFLVGVSFENERAEAMICTGSLIEASWVLTAGFCIAEDRKYYITYTRNTETYEKYVRVDAIGRNLHPEYTEKDHANNIGLLKVQSVPDITFAHLSMGDYTSRHYLPVLYARYWYDAVTKRTLHLAEFNITRCIEIHVKLEEFICVDDPPHFTMHDGAHLIYNQTKVIGIYSGFAKRFVPISDHYDWIRREREKDALRVSVALTFDFAD